MKFMQERMTWTDQIGLAILMKERHSRTDRTVLATLSFAQATWTWLTSPWSERTERYLFWSVIAITIPVWYLILSGLCAIGVDCTVANADTFLSFFGR